MLGVAALATSAIDLLQSLTAKKNASSASKTTTGLSQGGAFQPGTPTPIAATTGTTAGATPSSGNLSTSTMSALLDAQSQTNVSANSKTRSDALKSLFKLLDGDGDGSISKSEFTDKLGAGGTNVANAEKVFAKLDTDGNGSVSVDELSKVVKGIAKPQQDGSEIRLRGDNSDVTGATTSSAVNADGSTTTSITYADGSKVTSTSAAASSSTAAAARTSYNAVEQMIAKQAQQISSGASSLAISV
ncbi:EF-hand domain-containing protein [Tardiphaga alba]|uniref:EF-hand domain-containing protein n=1 Tax=Tardiphaga alba TaxID=340268 RepID=A0ABX8AAK2_9BRAD|nr:EF-hand domain-containing protein [Tardiphaga alba]QUS40799.1 EF-hand domain-containing protein [Tardiphaga alba]